MGRHRVWKIGGCFFCVVAAAAPQLPSVVDHKGVAPKPREETTAPKEGVYDPHLLAPGHRMARSVPERLQAIKEELKTEKYSDAVKFLSDTLRLPSNWVCRKEEKGKVDHNFFAEASGILRAMNAEQKEYYEKIYGGEARVALDAASLTGMPQNLYRVAKNFRHLDAGKTALRGLSSLYGDRGDFTMALLYCEAALQDEPQDAMLRLKAAIYARFAKKPEVEAEHRAVLTQLKKPVIVGGKPITPENLDAFLNQLTPSKQPEPAIDWMRGSNNERRAELLDALTFLGDRKPFFKVLGAEKFPETASLCDFIDLPNRLAKDSTPDSARWALWAQGKTVDFSNVASWDGPTKETLDNLLRDEHVFNAFLADVSESPNALEVARELSKMPNEQLHILGVETLVSLAEKSKPARDELLAQLPRARGGFHDHYRKAFRDHEDELLAGIKKFLDSPEEAIRVNAVQLIPEVGFKTLPLWEKVLADKNKENADRGAWGVRHLSGSLEKPEELEKLGPAISKILRGPAFAHGLYALAEARVPTSAFAEALFQFEQKATPEQRADYSYKEMINAWEKQGDVGVQTLLQHMKNPQERKTVANRIVAQAGTREPAASLPQTIPDLVELTQADPALRKALIHENTFAKLGAMAEKQGNKQLAASAIQALIESMKKGDAAERQEAVRGAAYFQGPSSKLGDQLAALGKDPDKEVRSFLALYLAYYPVDTAQKIFQALSHDPDERVRASAQASWKRVLGKQAERADASESGG